MIQLDRGAAWIVAHAPELAILHDGAPRHLAEPPALRAGKRRHGVARARHLIFGGARSETAERGCFAAGLVA